MNDHKSCTEFFECSCHSDEHTLKFTLDMDEFGSCENPELYTTVFLNDWIPWYSRIFVAIMYIFGYKSKYGHWDYFSLKEQDADRLINLLTRYKVAFNKNNQTVSTAVHD
jgi:hypothetical protein